MYPTFPKKNRCPEYTENAYKSVEQTNKKETQHNTTETWGKRISREERRTAEKRVGRLTPSPLRK